SHAPLEGLDEVRSEASGRDDGVDRTDPERPLDGVDAVELGRHLTELLGAYDRPRGGQLDAQPGALVALRAVQPGLELDHPWVGVGTGVDVAGEHGRGRRRTSDDRRVRPLDGD